MEVRDARALGMLFHGIVCAVAAGCDTTPEVLSAMDGGNTIDVAARDCEPLRLVQDPEAECPSETVIFGCGLPPTIVGMAPGSVLDLPLCNPWCTVTSVAGGTYCYLQNDDGGIVDLRCEIECIGGRRPEGYVDALRGDRSVQGWMTRLAALEASSVVAFERLARELRTHGAPEELVADALRAAHDERRHARMVGHLAGADPPSEMPMETTRPLATMARENAVEGCVRETWGALLATWQARHATNATIARLMHALTADETRHAALAWAVHGWAAGRMARKERDATARAMRIAMAELHRVEIDHPGAAWGRELGLPTGPQRTALIEGMERALMP